MFGTEPPGVAGRHGGVKARAERGGRAVREGGAGSEGGTRDPPEFHAHRPGPRRPPATRRHANTRRAQPAGEA